VYIENHDGKFELIEAPSD